MPDIFLSYNREDQAIARRFAEAFAADGLTVWWDVTLRSGEAYDEVTEAALREAKAVVVLWSKRSVVSRWVRAEATIADRNRTLVPVMIEACERPVMFELTQTADLSNWTGDAGAPAWRAFLADVRLFVDKSGEAPTRRKAELPAHVPARGGAPSLAVLPIVSRKDDYEDLAEDLTSELIGALSPNGYFKVIASGTAAAWRGKGSDLRAIGRELDARYVVEGNVRPSGSDLRLTFQLVEAESSNVLWPSKYTRTEDNVLDEDFLIQVANDIGDQVLRIEFGRALTKTGELTAWERLLRSMAAFSRLGADNNRIAIEEARQAIAIAPDFGLAHAMCATAVGTGLFMAAEDDAARTREVRAHVKKALDLDGDNPHVLGLCSSASRCVGDYRASLSYAQRASQVAPNMFTPYYHLGASYLALGKTAEALLAIKAEEKCAPHSTLRYLSLYTRGLAELLEGRLENAAAALDRSLQLNPNFVLALKWKAAVAAMLGRMDEAHEAARRVREVEPQTAIEQHQRQNSRAVPDKDVVARANAALHAVWMDMPAEALAS